MKNKFLNRFDYFLILCITILCVLGISFIYSSGIDQDGILKSRDYIKQIIWFSIGLVVMVGMTLFDYRRFLRYIPYIYGAFIVTLIFIFIIGKTLNNAQSWFRIGRVFFQPSEPGKLVFILFLGWYLDRSKNENPLKRFIVTLVILGLPMVLILLQPDLGTATVYIAIYFFMCLFAGIDLRYLMFILATGIIGVLFTILPHYASFILKKEIPILKIFTDASFTVFGKSIKVLYLLIFTSALLTVVAAIAAYNLKQKYFVWLAYGFGVIFSSFVLFIAASHALKPYQIMRLIIFVDPYADSLDSGWHIINSKIAIGSGNFLGRGFKAGTQSHYQFLSEQSTDFIFSILAEEIGFVGGLAVFISFLAIFFRIIHITRLTTNSYGTYLCTGVLGMLMYHFVINIGMVMGIMPVTGIPLPFVSYGGSSLLTNMMSIGLVMSISSRRLDFKMPI